MVRIRLSTRCIIITVSSNPFPVSFPSSSRSFSKWAQKNSGRCCGGTWGVTRPAMAPKAGSLLQLAQMKAECIKALRMHTTLAERFLSGGVWVQFCGDPRSWPLLVVSWLYIHSKHSNNAYTCLAVIIYTYMVVSISSPLVASIGDLHTLSSPGSSSAIIAPCDLISGSSCIVGR